MGETTLQSRFCALETRYEISQKKKNVVSRVNNLPWRPLSRVDFVLWRPDMRLAKKKKCGLQSEKSSLETTLQSRFCALETRYEISQQYCAAVSAAVCLSTKTALTLQSTHLHLDSEYLCKSFFRH